MPPSSFIRVAPPPPATQANGASTLTGLATDSSPLKSESVATSFTRALQRHLALTC
jgi:hypothetical protein